MPTKIRTVFCDDIRREDTGKMMLIGVYMDDLVPGVIPSNFPLSLWVTFKSEKTDGGKVSVIVNLPGGEKLKMDAEVVDMPVDTNVSFIFSGLPIEITKPGLVTVHLQFGDSEQIEAGSLIVRSPNDVLKTENQTH